MITAKLTKSSSLLDNIKANIQQLDRSVVESGFFTSQGVHIDGEYTYVDLAKALEFGQGAVPTPMPFLRSGTKPIGKLWRIAAVQDTKPQTRAYMRNLDKKRLDINPLLDAVGGQALKSAGMVFNNPVFFPQAPNNETPIFETGDLLNHFGFLHNKRTSIKEFGG